MKKLIILLCLFSIYFLNADIFKFKYSIGSKQKIECNIFGQYIINDVLQYNYIQKYSTIQTVKGIENNNAFINEENYYLIQGKTQIEKIVNTEYWKNYRGEMIVNGSEEFPNLRDMPLFPDKDIEPGYTWYEYGVEVQDIVNTKFINTVNVFYTFIGFEKVNNIDCAVFKYEFVSSREYVQKNVSILVGYTNVTLYFDNNQGTKVKELYTRDYIFDINGKKVEIKDSGVRFWSQIEKLNKTDIIKDIESNNLKDTTIKKDSKGIKISIENIQFLPNSSILLSTEKVRLDKIYKVLKKYNKNLLIVGHTALWGIHSNRMKLSVERSKSVTDYLIFLGYDPNKIIYSGRGALDPIGDNSTESGMKKNRRVEIYILEK